MTHMMGVGGNALRIERYHHHADADHPDVVGTWLADLNTPGEVWQGLTVRPRIQMRRAGPGSILNTALQIQRRWRDVAITGPWGTWARVTDVSTHLQIADSVHYDDLDVETVLLLPVDVGGALVREPRPVYCKTPNVGFTGSMSWENVNNRHAEPEWAMQITPAATVGGEFELRVLRANGDENEHASLVFPYLRVVTDPALVVGALDEAVATVLNDAGVGDFSAPADAAEPVITVGSLLSEPDEMITVFLAGGSSKRVLDSTPTVTVVSRSVSYVTADARAKAVASALDQYSGQKLNRPLPRIQAERAPEYKGRDGSPRQGGRHQWQQTFTIHTRRVFELN